MTLETMEPNPVWEESAHVSSLEPFQERADELTVHVWGADWCEDCRAVLPDFAAAMDAAGIPDESLHHYEVEKLDDGSKAGPKVEEYGIEYIPTIVIEDGDGEEVARFVENEAIPALDFLAEQLYEIETGTSA
jgi:thiol-disulfide isomerase/thioredoxin